VTVPRTEVLTRVEDGHRLSMLVWRFYEPLLVASTAPSGGGLGPRRWVVNAQVPRDYVRRDLEDHAAELAASTALPGDGVTMLTAVDVRTAVHREDSGVSVHATVGITPVTWAAAPPGDAGGAPSAPAAGTINVVAFLPVRLADAALLNALCTATEAKSQALFDAGHAGTGTPSDAVTVICHADGRAEPFGGPRSPWGARLARAVHAAVREGSSTEGPDVVARHR
jgi:adenosylcobinamide hydrolase